MKQNVSFFADFLPCVEVTAVKAKARADGCRHRQDAEQTQTAFQELGHEAFPQSSHGRKYFAVLLDSELQRRPWNIRRALKQGNEHCMPFVLPGAGFIGGGGVARAKALSCQAKAVSCFNKGKVPKRLHFGRAFQLGRLGGNFLIVGACTSLRMADPASVRPRVGEHQRLFGEGTLHSCGTDKGYYSGANHKHLRVLVGLGEFCLQHPGLDPSSLSEQERATSTRLTDRRAGIEPLIGHAKQGGPLGHSRMTHDETTLAAGYASSGGCNLRQLLRHLLGKEIKTMV